MRFKPRFSAVLPTFVSAEGCGCPAEGREGFTCWLRSLRFLRSAVVEQWLEPHKQESGIRHIRQYYYFRDNDRLQAFIRRSHRSLFVPPRLPPLGLDELCRASDDKLFASITNNREHVLHKLLPPQSVASQNYNLRPRKHHFELPNKTSHLTDCNFMQRMLFLETYCRSILSCYFHFISFILTYF